MSSRSIADLRRSLSRAVLLGAALAPGLAWGVAPNRPIYRVHAGDMIEIAVAGLPELHMRSSVQPDGAVSLPLVGAIVVAGLTPSELRETVQAQFALKVYRTRSNDGREVMVIIQPEEVSAAIAEYRPIYVNGDVSRPGELVFRPEMTVRQAIALAGGLDAEGRRLSANPAVEAAEARSEYETATIELAKAEARVARLQGEIKGLESLDGIKFEALPPQPALDRIRQGENDIMHARLIDYRRERDFLEASIRQFGERTAVLERQQKQEDDGARADTEELQRTIELLSRGNVVNTRVLDARRALLLSQTRALQVTDSVLNMKKQSTETARLLQHFDDDRKTQLLNELQEATTAADVLKIKRKAAQRKMDLVSFGRSQVSVDDDSQTEIRLVRQDREGSNTTKVNGDFWLAPGDVLEVAIKSH